jgi:O-antigen/teichoic acid export membrane protein
MQEKSLKKNYFYNLSYQLLQIILPLITAPYVSRVLTVEGVGKQSFTHSLASYFLLFGSLSIGLYGQREIAYNRDNDYKKTKIFWELCVIKAITVSLSLCVYIIIINRFSDYRLFFLIYTIEIIACLFDVTWYFQGMENFKIIVIRNAIIKIITISFVFIVIKKPTDLYKYILLTSASSFLANISLLPFLLRQLISIKIRISDCIRHIKPIMMLFIPQIAVQIYTVLDKSMIGFITQSSYENGCYEQAMKIVKTLLTIITSLGIVVVPRMGYLNAKGKLDKINDILMRSFNFVFFLGTPLFFGLIGIADVFVPLFFGQGYDKSIILIRILSGLFIAIGLNNVIGVQYLIPLKKERVFTITVLFGAFINFVLNIFLINRYQAIGAALSSVIAESIIAIIQFFYIRKIFNITSIFFGSWRNMASSIIMIIVLYVLKLIIPVNVLSLLFMIFISCVVYFLLLLLLQDKFVLSLINTIVNKGHL